MDAISFEQRARSNRIVNLRLCRRKFEILAYRRFDKDIHTFEGQPFCSAKDCIKRPSLVSFETCFDLTSLYRRKDRMLRHNRNESSALYLHRLRQMQIKESTGRKQNTPTF